MELILDVSNDLVSDGLGDGLVDEALVLLTTHREEHQALIEYWALEGESLDDCFALTPAIRNIRHGVA